ncbi:MAG: hypothetical protein CVV63_00075 [Tenericutes bacterium HGW-Tenericutes-8]|nr:MAG: hypothetical protein CVV63_00075 [Tenericutes bacterium HGW-Tenericutes-8]
MKPLSKIEELLALFDDSDLIKRYHKFEETINGDKELLKRLAQMKALQRQLVNAKAIHKKNAIEQFQNEYDVMRHDIENNPLVETYLDLQNELNDILIEVKEIIETEINKELSKYNFVSEK